MMSAETAPFPITREILVSIWGGTSEQHHWEVAAAGDGPGLSAGAGQQERIIRAEFSPVLSVTDCHLPQFQSLAAPGFLSRDRSLCSCLRVTNH